MKIIEIFDCHLKHIAYICRAIKRIGYEKFILFQQVSDNEVSMAEI
jgi:hypothetical protein